MCRAYEPHAGILTGSEESKSKTSSTRPAPREKSGFYVEISRARDRAELVTDDAAELRAQLQAVTGERIAALDGIGEMAREVPGKGMDPGAKTERVSDLEKTGGAVAERESPTPPAREKSVDKDFGL